MMTILILIFAHCIGDYVFQSQFLATVKATNDFILSVHSILWAGVICLTMFMLGNEASYLDIIILFVGHFVIDRIKSRKEDKTFALTDDLYFDQIAHMIQIMFVWYF